MSASTTRPVQYSVPLPLSIFARPRQRGLMRSWRADSLCLRVARSPELPHVAEVFCPSECVRLIQDQASMRNVDSRIHSLRFDCCVFLFYSFSAVTFATKSAQRVSSLRCQPLDALGGEADMLRRCAAHVHRLEQRHFPTGLPRGVSGGATRGE